MVTVNITCSVMLLSANNSYCVNIQTQLFNDTPACVVFALHTYVLDKTHLSSLSQFWL